MFFSTTRKKVWLAHSLVTAINTATRPTRAPPSIKTRLALQSLWEISQRPECWICLYIRNENDYEIYLSLVVYDLLEHTQNVISNDDCDEESLHICHHHFYHRSNGIRFKWFITDTRHTRLLNCGKVTHIAF